VAGEQKRGIRKWIVWGAMGAGVLPLAVMGLWGYMIATATPLHPNPEDVSSVTDSVPAPQWTEAVEQARAIARAGLAEQNLPGLSVAVGVGGETVWAEGFGWADLENQVPVKPETRFRIGTASTALTSAAVGVLVEQGRLKFDDTIQTHVPAFPEQPWPVTLRQVMAHVSGVRTDAGDEEPVRVSCRRTADVLPRFAGRPLLFEPGTRFRYSTYGWVLVSAAVEAVAGEPFFSFMRRHIFEPLGMQDTTVDSRTESIVNRATYYFPRFAADPRYGPQEPGDEDFSCFAGAGAFLSTPSDLVRFVTAIDAGKLLQPATVRTLQATQQLVTGEDTGYGLGWDLETVTLSGTPVRVISHDGDLRGGKVSSLLVYSELQLVVAVTANTSFADTSAIALGLAEVFGLRLYR
jgi:CubicO group peptidase (beta-lactamase class C family)